MAKPHYNYEDSQQGGGDFKEKLVAVKRVTKVVKGGKQMALTTLVTRLTATSFSLKSPPPCCESS